MSAYYNEHDPFAAAWLRELIADGHIPAGDVDERDIQDVTANDVTAYDQCHFFAGIGGWPLALRLAGWPDDRPVWTGSAPCQPFSAAGSGGGFADERHLWPAFFWLIRQCRPPILFGEQVASKAGLDWFDVVSADLEAAGYAIGSADLCAAGVGAPHIRQRLYFVADADKDGRAAAPGPQHSDAERDAESRCCMDNPISDGRHEGRRERHNGKHDRQQLDANVRNAGFWNGIEWLPCLDGKARPTKPGIFPLAHGVSGRVGLLRGAGNAIVPPLAAEFIGAYMELLQ